MELADGIRKIGFRRWYERQLIESHLYLISGILCLVTVAASAEELNLRTPAWETALRLGALLGGVVICLWAFRRYLQMLAVAEYAAERSVCERCTTYRGLEVTAVDARGAWKHREDGEGVLAPVTVRCRQCGHEWTIE
jgi:hypothetical protein